MPVGERDSYGLPIVAGGDFDLLGEEEALDASQRHGGLGEVIDGLSVRHRERKATSGNMLSGNRRMLNLMIRW